MAGAGLGELGSCARFPLEIKRPPILPLPPPPPPLFSSGENESSILIICSDCKLPTAVHPSIQKTAKSAEQTGRMVRHRRIDASPWNIGDRTVRRRSAAARSCNSNGTKTPKGRLCALQKKNKNLFSNPGITTFARQTLRNVGWGHNHDRVTVGCCGPM